MKQAIVHVGLHRCASTSIQKLLEATRSQVEASGTDLVLRSDLSANRRLKDFRSIPRPDTTGVKGWWRGTMGSAALSRFSRDKLLISEEALSGTMPGHSSRQFYPRQGQLWAALARSRRLEVHPRIVVRRQDKWIESVYGFRVGQGLPVSFDEFVKKFDPTQIDFNSLLETVDRFTLLGRTRIGVLEDWTVRGPLQCALNFLKLPEDIVFTRFERNKRQPPHVLPILVSLNQIIGDELSYSQRQTLSLSIRHLAPDCSRNDITSVLEATLPVELQPRIGEILSNYDPAMPVKLTGDQQIAWRSATRDINREFLAHPAVNVDHGIWEDD